MFVALENCPPVVVLMQKIHVSRIMTLMLFAGFALPLDAQIIDNRQGKVFQEEMYFNQQFIWQNKIKSITGVKSIKRPNRAIEQRPDLIAFRFNEVGQLTSLDKISSVLHLVDSLQIFYQRNSLGDLELKTEQGTKGYHTTNYHYDQQGRLDRLSFGKTENLSHEKGKLEPGQAIVVNSETYEWVESAPHVLKKKNYNNYGLHYSNWTLTKNDLGYIQSETEELIMSGRTTTKTYTYQEKGWIAETVSADNQNTATKTEKFRYDELGNLTKVEYFINGKIVREIEVLYKPTLLLEAFLDHDMVTDEVVITKFSFEYYP
jgi:hypothetical protein